MPKTTNTVDNLVVNESMVLQNVPVATQSYVDNLIQGLRIHKSVRAAESNEEKKSDILDETYFLEPALSNGDQFILTKENGDSNDRLELDGVLLKANDRILVNVENDKDGDKDNGVYQLRATTADEIHGNLDVGDLRWYRTVDMDEPSEVKNSYVFVNEGTVNGGYGYVLASQVDQTFTVGSDKLLFTIFQGQHDSLAEYARNVVPGSTLDIRLNNEASDRANLSSELSIALNAEVNDRSTAVANEKASRESADNTLTANLASEVSNRETAVANEKASRESADNTLTANLASEVSDRETAVANEKASREEAVANEKASRESADSSLQSQIDDIFSGSTKDLVADGLVIGNFRFTTSGNNLHIHHRNGNGDSWSEPVWKLNVE